MSIRVAVLLFLIATTASAQENAAARLKRCQTDEASIVLANWKDSSDPRDLFAKGLCEIRAGLPQSAQLSLQQALRHPELPHALRPKIESILTELENTPKPHPFRLIADLAYGYENQVYQYNFSSLGGSTYTRFSAMLLASGFWLRPSFKNNWSNQTSLEKNIDAGFQTRFYMQSIWIQGRAWQNMAWVGRELLGEDTALDAEIGADAPVITPAIHLAQGWHYHSGSQYFYLDGNKSTLGVVFYAKPTSLWNLRLSADMTALHFGSFNSTSFSREMGGESFRLVWQNQIRFESWKFTASPAYSVKEDKNDGWGSYTDRSYSLFFEVRKTVDIFEIYLESSIESRRSDFPSLDGYDWSLARHHFALGVSYEF